MNVNTSLTTKKKKRKNIIYNNNQSFYPFIQFLPFKIIFTIKYSILFAMSLIFKSYFPGSQLFKWSKPFQIFFLDFWSQGQCDYPVSLRSFQSQLLARHQLECFPTGLTRSIVIREKIIYLNIFWCFFIQSFINLFFHCDICKSLLAGNWKVHMMMPYLQQMTFLKWDPSTATLIKVERTLQGELSWKKKHLVTSISWSA